VSSESGPPPSLPSDSEDLETRERVQELLKSLGIRKSIFLCSTFRSGTSHFAFLLEDNGVPNLRVERFNVMEQQRIALQPSAARFALFEAAIRRGTNGDTFATKLAWGHWAWAVSSLGMDWNELPRLSSIFPDPLFMFVKRLDIFAQGISLWRAKKTGQWEVFAEGGRARTDVPEYDLAAILPGLREQLLANALWEEFFQRGGFDAESFEYESLVRDPHASVVRALNFLKLPLPAHVRVRPRIRKQADAASDNLRERLLRDLLRPDQRGRPLAAGRE